MACVSKALIIGGGLAGLSAAVALSRVGVSCEVVELNNTHLGASLGVSGRAAEALDELGIYDEVYATGRPFILSTGLADQRAADGQLISPAPQRPQWPGAKTGVGVYRPVLLKILEDTARSLGVTIRAGLTFQTIEDQDDAAVVRFSDGTEGRYDLVIGADGIGSQTRTTLFPEAPSPSYSGQFSVRWMIPGPPIEGESWYISPVARMGFYALPNDMVYAVAVFSTPQWRRMGKEEVYSLVTEFLDSCSAPAVVEIRRRLTPESELICRPFEWVLVQDRWYEGRTVLVGDAAHATTAHMGMGGGMAIEDAVVLAQCVQSSATIGEALETFMARRFERVRTVVDTSVTLSQMEQDNVPTTENVALMTKAYHAIGAPY